MRTEFSVHNLFKQDIQEFLRNDPHLRELKNLPYVYEPPLQSEIPLHVPGIYILTGGRQVGKTTLLKLLIRNLLVKGKVDPAQIYYISCDLFERYHDLVAVLHEVFEEIDRYRYFYLFLDEVTYVHQWDRAIKHFADMGYFIGGSMLITGSNSSLLKESMKHFPGRRGKSQRCDFHYYPLSFADYIRVKIPDLRDEVRRLTDMKIFEGRQQDEKILSLQGSLEADRVKRIAECFQEYLLTGGFLSAMNEHEKNEKSGKIRPFVYRTYQQWVVGDMLKWNKKEHSLKELIAAVGERLAKQITLHALTALTQFHHHDTVRDYIEILENMDVLFLLHALREDRPAPAPKKAKKIHFCDPFIALALIAWAKGIDDPWSHAQKHIVAESPLKADLVEGCISSLMRRTQSVYYIKSEGEVDLAVLGNKKFTPVEIKWSERLHKSDLKQILKYRTGIVGYKGIRFGKFEHLHVVPVSVLALLASGPGTV